MVNTKIGKDFLHLTLCSELGVIGLAFGRHLRVFVKRDYHALPFVFLGKSDGSIQNG